jgi:hypothetical protein
MKEKEKAAEGQEANANAGELQDIDQDWPGIHLGSESR